MDFSPDEFHRTIKLELDEGRARTLDEAHDIVAHYVFQIDVGVDVSESETRQAMLVTAVNAASRAFLGGVRVRLPDNRLMGVGWARGMDMATTVKTYGGEIVESLECEYPTLVIGKVVEQPPGSIILRTTWQGWSGGVVEEEKDRLAESLEFPWQGCLQQRSEYRRPFNICEAMLSLVGVLSAFRSGSRRATGGMNPPMANHVFFCRRGSG